MRVILRIRPSTAISWVPLICALFAALTLLAIIATPQVIITVGESTWGPPRDVVQHYRVYWVFDDETGGSKRMAGYEAAVTEMAMMMVAPGVVWAGVEKD
jgi:hypothetical protein